MIISWLDHVVERVQTYIKHKLPTNDYIIEFGEFNVCMFEVLYAIKKRPKTNSDDSFRARGVGWDRLVRASQILLALRSILTVFVAVEMRH